MKRFPATVHLVLVLEGDLLHGHLVALVEVVRAVGHVLSLCKRDVEDRSHTERGDAGAGQLEEVAATDIQAGSSVLLYFQSRSCLCILRVSSAI